MPWTDYPSHLPSFCDKGSDRIRGRAEREEQINIRSKKKKKKSYLVDGSDFDTLHNLCLHFLPSVLIQLGVVASDLALIYLAQQPHHVRVEHRREEVCMQRWVPEPLFEFVSPRIRALRVDLGSGKLFRGRNKVPEGRVEVAVDVDLESTDNQNWR